MSNLIEQRDGRWWVANPAEDRENFADKWNDYPQRRVQFWAWLAEITKLLEAIAQMGGQGIHRRRRPDRGRVRRQRPDPQGRPETRDGKPRDSRSRDPDHDGRRTAD